MNVLAISSQEIRLGFFEWILTKMPTISISNWVFKRLFEKGTKKFNQHSQSFELFFNAVKENPAMIDVDLFNRYSLLNAEIKVFYEKIIYLRTKLPQEKAFVQAVEKFHIMLKDFENYIIMQSFEDNTPVKGFNNTFKKDWNSKEDEIWETYL